MYMLMFVLDDPEHLDAVLDAWDEIGVSGVTIIESTGINRRRRAQLVGTTIMAGINRLMSGDQEMHVTLYTIIESEAVAQACLQAAEQVVGDLDKPNTGVLAIWPLTAAKGVPTNS
jgi:nitrogen regulatory protein PII